MADQGLQLRVGADVTEFQKGLNDAVKSIQSFDAKTQAAIKGTVNNFKSLDQLGARLKRLQDAQSKATDPKVFGGLQKAIDVTRTRVELLKKGFDDSAKAAAGFTGAGITRGAGQAQTALINLGRVASDLPFGFIAIQNNLDPLFQSFQQLSSKAGGAVGGLKLLGYALVGAGGLSLAFSVVSSAVTIAIQKYGSLGNAIQALVGGNEKLILQQKLITDVVKEGNKNAGEEVAQFQYLAQAVANTALSDKVRADALKKLKEEYPAYLQNLTDEEIINGKLTSSINETVKALKAKAIAQAAVAKAGALSSQILDALQKEEELTKNITDLEAKRLRDQGKVRVRVGGSITGADAGTTAAQDAERAINAQKRLREEVAAGRKVIEGQIDLLFGLAQTQTKLAGDAAIAQSKQNKGLTDQEKIQKKILQEKLKGYESEQKAVERIYGATSTKYLQLARTIANTKSQISLIGETDAGLIKEINTTLANDLADINAKLTQNEREELKKRLQYTLEKYKKEEEAIKKTAGTLSTAFLEAQKKTVTAQANLDINVAIQQGDLQRVADIKKELATALEDLDKEFSEKRFINGQIEYVPLLTADLADARAKWKKLFESIRKTGFEEAAALSQKKIEVKPKIVFSPEVQGVLDAIGKAKQKLDSIGDDILDSLIESYGKVGPLSKDVVNQLTKVAAAAAQGAQVFSQLFTPIIDNFFDNIQNGKSAFESLGKSIKQFVINAIKELVKLAAIAAGISLFSGGKISFGTAFGIASKGSMFGSRNQAAPNFGGLQGGAIAVTVGGQFNVRGTDLVAVVAQSNQRIGRVG